MDAMLLLKASLILVLALVAAPLLARFPAVTRHQIWTSTFAALLALPLLGLGLPALAVPVPARLSALVPLHRPIEGETAPRASLGTKALSLEIATDLTRDRATATNAFVSTPLPDDARDARARAVSIAFEVLPIVWLVGTIAAVAALLLSLLRVALLARVSDVIADPSWDEAAQTLGAPMPVGSPVRLPACGWRTLRVRSSKRSAAPPSSDSKRPGRAEGRSSRGRAAGSSIRRCGAAVAGSDARNARHAVGDVVDSRRGEQPARRNLVTARAPQFDARGPLLDPW